MTSVVRAAVRLRAVSDTDRAFLLQTMDFAPLAQRANALLARCLIAEPGVDGNGVVHALTVGEREALLLDLHRLTFGEVLDCVLRCPAPQCGQQLELSPRVTDLLMPPYHDARRTFELATVVDSASHHISFRLPIAADLDEVAAFASRDVEGAALSLLRRCVRAAARDGVPVDIGEMPAAVRDAVAQEMLRLDPQAELELTLDCPVCGWPFAVVLDAASYLLKELDAQAVQMLREVHLLASQYGWSESEILCMPAPRRARYIDLIAEAQVRARS